MFGLIRKWWGAKPVDFKEVVLRGALVIDVRSIGEFQSGHLPGSRNYPLDQLRKSIPELKKLKKPLITVCRSGTRSSMARNILVSAGLEVYNGGPWHHLLRKIG